MKKLGLALMLFVILYACAQQNEGPFKVEEVSPWCILGFDILDRTPPQRIAMLKELGFTKYGYNRGKGTFEEMKEEFDLAKQNDIEITSVFLWLNAKRDSIGKLSPANQDLLNNLKEVDYKPTIWVSFSDNYFKDLTQEQSVDLSIQFLTFVKARADELGCKLAIYNHHGWFGNPYNQVEILEKLNEESLTMVYNFHHAQDYVDQFSEIAKMITPYLSFVNLNGVKKDGPQIIPIGKGDHEIEMIRQLRVAGYKGPWGILGHIKTEDVRKVLEENISGLNLLNTALTDL